MNIKNKKEKFIIFKDIRRDKYFCNWNNENGITLISLVVTIIILIILASMSIMILTNTGLFEKTKEAKEKSKNMQISENRTLMDYENSING